jgi:hypothetical protein
MALPRPFVALVFLALLWPLSGAPTPAAPAQPVLAGQRQDVVVSATVPVALPVIAAPTFAATDARIPIGDAPVPGRAPEAVSAVVLDAYRLAASLAPASCHLDVSLLAAIGQVESGNLAGRSMDDRHRAVPAVLGPVLDGSGNVAAIRDTDGGQLDGNANWDRAVGPMQLLPSTWRIAGVDVDADGVRDPQDTEDAAGAAMVYLCAFGHDLADPAALRTAIRTYNHSAAYVRLVLAWKHAYDVYGLQLGVLPSVRLTAWRAVELRPHSRGHHAAAPDRPRRPRPVAHSVGSGPAEASTHLPAPSTAPTGTPIPAADPQPAAPASPPAGTPTPAADPQPAAPASPATTPGTSAVGADHRTRDDPPTAPTVCSPTEPTEPTDPADEPAGTTPPADGVTVPADAPDGTATTASEAEPADAPSSSVPLQSGPCDHPQPVAAKPPAHHAPPVSPPSTHPAH